MTLGLASPTQCSPWVAGLLVLGLVGGCAIAPAATRSGAPAGDVEGGGPGTQLAGKAVTVTVQIVEPSSAQGSWRFEPSAVTARVGDSIMWANTGGAAHTATAPGAFDSGDLVPAFRSRPGGTYSWTATTAGTFAYACTYHPWMTGTLVVTAGG